MSENYLAIITTPSGTGKSVLDTLLKLQGIPFISGPVHIDEHEDDVEAAKAAHNIAACLPEFHDAVFEATGKSLSDERLYSLLGTLPVEISEQINDWGLADTEVREQIYAHLQQNPI